MSFESLMEGGQCIGMILMIKFYIFIKFN